MQLVPPGWPLEQIHYHGTVDFDTVNTKLPYWDEGNLDSSSLQWINFPFGRLKGRVVPFDCDCDKCKLDQSPTHMSSEHLRMSQFTAWDFCYMIVSSALPAAFVPQRAVRHFLIVTSVKYANSLFWSVPLYSHSIPIWPSYCKVC